MMELKTQDSNATINQKSSGEANKIPISTDSDVAW